MIASLNPQFSGLDYASDYVRMLIKRQGCAQADTSYAIHFRDDEETIER